MNLSWSRLGPLSGGEAQGYGLLLPSDERAELRVVADGWELVISTRSGRVVRRGLFASPHDALMVLEAEYYPPEPGGFP
jgi:hypothetical protein